MNPAGFPAQGGVMPPADNQAAQMANPQRQKQQNDGTTMVMRHLMQKLKSQGPFAGWQESVSVHERANKIYQLVSSLRLVQPKDNSYSVIDAAVKFEEKCFRESPVKAKYDKDIMDKLVQIRDNRQQRASRLQNGMVSQPGLSGQMTAPTPNQMQPSMYPNQIPQNMQPQNPQMQMPQHQQPQPQPQQQQQQQQPGSTPNMQNPQMQMRPQQQFAPNGQQQRPSLPGPSEFNNLSPQELSQVHRLAEEMAQKASKADMEKVHIFMQSLSPESKQALAQQGITPPQHIFRIHALKELRKHKANQMGMAARAQRAQTDSGNPMGNSGMANGQQRQGAQSMMGNQGAGGMPMDQQAPDPSFASSIDHIQGQQADGLRSQEAGQLVVPSTGAMLGQQQYGGQQNVNRAGMNPAMIARQQKQQQHQQQQQQQQQRQNAQNAQQEKIQQAAQLHQAHPQAQARAHAANNPQMAMSAQQQQNSQMAHSMSQQSPPMPMINRPMGPSPVNQSQPGGPRQAPPSRTPGMNHDQPSGPTSRPAIPPGLPLALQNQLASMSPDQVEMVLQTYQRRTFPNGQGMQRPNQAPGQVQQQSGLVPTELEQTSQRQQPQFSMGGPAGTGMPPQQHPQQHQQPQQVPHQTPGMGVIPTRTQAPQGQQAPMHQPQQGNDIQRFQHLQQQSAAVEMTEEQVRNMDRFPFPSGVLNSCPNLVAVLPKTVKSWGQLKLYVSQNPQLVQEVSLQKLQMMQKMHFIQWINAQRESANRNSGQNGGPSQPGMMQNVPQSMPNQPNAQQGQHQQPPGGPGQQQAAPNLAAMMRPVTANDVRVARQRFGTQVQSLSDEALRQLLEKNRQEQIMKHSKAAGTSQSFPTNNNNLNQAPKPEQGTSQPQQMEQPATSQSAQMQRKQQAQAQKSPTVAQPPAARAQAGKANARGTKRASEAEAEAPPVATTSGPQMGASQAQTTAGAPARPMPQPTREQLAAMNPQQRSQWEAYVRQRRAQSRMPISKASAEEAWSHIPDSAKRVYAELIRNEPEAIPAAMTADTKAKVARTLQASTDMIGRIDSLVNFLIKSPIPDKLREVLRYRMILMKQFKDPDWTPVDQFTISPEDLNSTLREINKCFAFMISHASKQNAAATAANKGTTPQTQADQQKASMPALNASNLQQLEQQEAALQRAKRAHNQGPPTAPTTSQPPFPIGATSPQGVPHAYGQPAAVTQENLSIPPSAKRAKRTPTQKEAGQQPQAQTTAGPGKKAPPAKPGKPAEPVKESFKCAVPECQYSLKGFPSQAELDKHTEEHRKEEEPITNPYEFVIESIRIGLGLDKKDGETKQTQSAATEGQSQSAKPGATPSAPQMAGQAGTAAAKSKSPGKTPSGSNLKQANSLRNNATESKEGKKDASKAEESPPEETNDPWLTSKVSLEEIHSAFGDLDDDTLFKTGYNPLDELLSKAAFTDIQAKDTPQTADTYTPPDKDSDASKEEVTPTSGMNEKWMSASWVHLPGVMEDTLMMQEPWEEIDWDNVIEDDPMILDNSEAKPYSI